MSRSTCMAFITPSSIEISMNLDDLKDYYRARPKPSEERLLLNAIHKRSRWVEFLNTILKDGSATPALKEAFHLKWIESGHFIREKVNNDEILTKLLVTLLPKYEGEAVTIYRGKNEDRFNSGSIGFCWTQDRELLRCLVADSTHVNPGGCSYRRTRQLRPL